MKTEVIRVFRTRSDALAWYFATNTNADVVTAESAIHRMIVDGEIRVLNVTIEEL